MQELSVKVEIKTTLSNPADEKFADSLQEAFTSEGIASTTTHSRFAFKSHEPITIDITIQEAIIVFVATRYFLEPVAKNIESLVAKWWKAVREKDPLTPVHLKISFTDSNFEIITLPYIVDQNFLGDLLKKIEIMLSILNDQGLLPGVTAIRLISESIDKILVIAYQSAKPAYVIDFETSTAIPLSKELISHYSGYTDDSADGWMKMWELKHKLYIELIQKIKSSKD